MPLCPQQLLSAAQSGDIISVQGALDNGAYVDYQGSQGKYISTTLAYNLKILHLYAN